MANTLGSDPCDRNILQVQVLSSAPKKCTLQMGAFFLVLGEKTYIKSLFAWVLTFLKQKLSVEASSR